MRIRRRANADAPERQKATAVLLMGFSVGAVLQVRQLRVERRSFQRFVGKSRR